MTLLNSVAYLICDFGEVARVETAEAFAILLRLLPGCEALEEIKREVEVLHEVRREYVRSRASYRKTLPRNGDPLEPF
jgi:hypothetical protein